MEHASRYDGVFSWINRRLMDWKHVQNLNFIDVIKYEVVVVQLRLVMWFFFSFTPYLWWGNQRERRTKCYGTVVPLASSSSIRPSVQYHRYCVYEGQTRFHRRGRSYEYAIVVSLNIYRDIFLFDLEFRYWKFKISVEVFSASRWN